MFLFLPMLITLILLFTCLWARQSWHLRFSESSWSPLCLDLLLFQLFCFLFVIVCLLLWVLITFCEAPNYIFSWKVLYKKLCIIIMIIMIMMMLSRCLGRQPSELEVGKSPSFLAAFHGGTPPFDRAFTEFWEYTKFSDDALNKIGFARCKLWMLLQTWLHWYLKVV